jgi:hypothetical protein
MESLQADAPVGGKVLLGAPRPIVPDIEAAAVGLAGRPFAAQPYLAGVGRAADLGGVGWATSRLGAAPQTASGRAQLGSG